jgi:tetratricopeptide (TPR) repeat protein
MSGFLGMASLATLTWQQVGIWSDSVGLWLRVLSIDDASALPWNNLGVSLLEDGNLPGAIEAHEHAYELAPNDPENCHRLAYVYSRAGRISDAEALYRRAIDVDPEYVDSRVNLAELVSARSQPDAAIAILQEAVRINPDHPEARTNLANLLRSLGRLEDAESHYRHVIRTTPTYADASFNLGEMLVSQQRISEAIEVWSAGVASCPRDVPMTINLSLALLTCPDPAMRDGAKALELADRACRLTHESEARALYARGQALRAAGRSTEALEAFRRARSLAARAGDSALVEHLDPLVAAPGP